MTEQNIAIKDGDRTFTINRDAFYDPETRPIILAELIRRVCPTAKKVNIQLPNDEVIHLEPKRVLKPTAKTSAVDWVKGGVSEEEYAVEKELITTLGGKSVKRGDTPYVYHAKEDGSVEYDIPLATKKQMRGEIKNLQDNHERKWSVQARLRAKVLAKGGKLKSEE